MKDIKTVDKKNDFRIRLHWQYPVLPVEGQFLQTLAETWIENQIGHIGFLAGIDSLAGIGFLGTGSLERLDIGSHLGCRVLIVGFAVLPVEHSFQQIQVGKWLVVLKHRIDLSSLPLAGTGSLVAETGYHAVGTEVFLEIGSVESFGFVLIVDSDVLPVEH